jgi:two-component system, NtrC family, nitrogen regulation response regulator NtrX
MTSSECSARAEQEGLQEPCKSGRWVCRSGTWMATVLIVEDQPQILALAQSLLEEEGYKTLSATTADGALAVLAEAKPVDILLVDIILSGDMQAGIELAKHAVEMNPGLKMIYSTALTLTDRTKELLLPGSVILEKPYTIDELLTSLSEPRVRV